MKSLTATRCYIHLAKIARLVEDNEDTHFEEEVEPLLRFKFLKPRRSTLLDDVNDILLH